MAAVQGSFGQYAQGQAAAPSLSSAHALYRQRRYGEVLAAEPSRTDAMLLKGATHFQMRDFRSCIECNEAAVRTDPSFAGESRPRKPCRVGVAARDSAFRDSTCLVRRTLAAGPPRQRLARPTRSFAEAYGNLGNALKELGDLDGAVRFYNKVFGCAGDHSALRAQRSSQGCAAS
ncbi:SEC [Symbiodinium sp. KB8]|nr:SEC [Symbiodinium sp. KB8]